MVVLRDLNDAPKVTAVGVLTGQRGSHSDDDLEILIGLIDRGLLRISGCLLLYLLLVALVLRIGDVAVGRSSNGHLALVLLGMGDGSHAARGSDGEVEGLTGGVGKLELHLAIGVGWRLFASVLDHLLD